MRGVVGRGESRWGPLPKWDYCPSLSTRKGYHMPIRGCKATPLLANPAPIYIYPPIYMGGGIGIKPYGFYLYITVIFGPPYPKDRWRDGE